MKDEEARDEPSRPAPVRTFEDGRTSRWGLDEGDLSLLDWMLELSPAERLRAATGVARSLEAIRRARRV